MKKLFFTLVFNFFGIVAFGQYCYPVANFNCSNPSTVFAYTYYTAGGTGPTCAGGTGATTVHGYCGFNDSATVPPVDAGDYPACYFQHTGAQTGYVGNSVSESYCNSQAPINTGLIFLIIAGAGAGAVTFYSKEKSKLRTNV